MPQSRERSAAVVSLGSCIGSGGRARSGGYHLPLPVVPSGQARKEQRLSLLIPLPAAPLGQAREGRRVKP